MTLTYKSIRKKILDRSAHTVSIDKNITILLQLSGIQTKNINIVDIYISWTDGLTTVVALSVL